MADTQRNLDALQTLLADNSTGEISPQDLRDMLVSLYPGHAHASITTPAATTLSDTSTWVQVAGTYTLGASSYKWTMAVNGRLACGADTSRDVDVTATISMTAAGNNQVLEFAIAVDGVIDATTTARTKIGTGADVAAVTCIGHVTVAPGEYISVMCRNTTSAVNVTAVLLGLAVSDTAEEA